MEESPANGGEGTGGHQPLPSMLPPANAREPTVRAILRVVVTVILSVLALYLVYLVRTPLFFLAVATFVAVAVSGPVNTLSDRMPRGLAITAVYSGLLLIPIVIGAILIPPAVSAISSLVSQLPTYVDDVTEFVQGNKQLQSLNSDFDLTTKLEELAQNLASDLDVVAGELANVGAGFLGSLFAVFTIVVLSIFMVSRGRQWTDVLIRFRPENERRAIRRGLDRMAFAVSSYVGGALAQATVAGVAAFIVLSILGVDAPLALAVIVALLDLIPLIGATIGAFIVMLVTLFTDFPTATIIWVLFAIAYQQFENYVIQPRIQARAVKLDPFIIVVAALFGGFMLGVVGALLAIPTAAAMQIAVREVIAYRRAVAAGTLDEHLADDEPPPEGPEPPDPGGEPAPDPA